MVEQRARLRALCLHVALSRVDGRQPGLASRNIIWTEFWGFEAGVISAIEFADGWICAFKPFHGGKV